ncbi:unnamed protein product [Prorocentrum cordatum]|uniref:Uncharacterized protein n=1 Tax=Prorocentrum cordatum TaxID=2364126 RepID=A0ABN9VKI4_9DINO|nr:unnamed protein product [Polarella glacialis]
MACIEHGYVKVSVDASVSWMTKVVTVDGVDFVVADRQSSAFTRYLGSSRCCMLDHLTELRNSETDRLIIEHQRSKMAKRESMMDTSGAEPLPKAAKREVADEVSIELTEPNMNILLKKPKVSTVSPEPVWRPQIYEEHVKWIPSRQSLRVKVYNAARGNWFIKSKKVSEHNRSNVDEIARRLEEYYVTNHSDPPDGKAEPQFASDLES